MRKVYKKHFQNISVISPLFYKEEKVNKLGIFMNFVVISVDIVDNFVDIYMLSAIICAE